jgi:hypothetical protein
VGTGLWIAGGNDNVVRDNHFYDNWRRGVMLFQVPDQLVCGPTGINPEQLPGCNPGKVPASTSYRNQFYGNVMGRAPDGTVLSNGNEPAKDLSDFWWDQGTGNTGNCWHNNIGKDGTEASVTSTPPSPVLPSDCSDQTTPGGGGAAQEQELTACFAAIEKEEEKSEPASCPWWTTPSKP